MWVPKKIWVPPKNYVPKNLGHETKFVSQNQTSAVGGWVVRGGGWVGELYQ